MHSERIASSLHHLAIGARDVERLAGFYSDVFCLPEIRRQFEASGQLRSIWLALDEAIFMVERTTHSRPTVDDVDAGLFIIAFRVESEQRAEVEQRLSNLGHALESATQYSSYYRDPEGNRFAISHYPRYPHP